MISTLKTRLRQMRREGKADQLSGKVKDVAERLKDKVDDAVDGLRDRADH